MTADNAPTPTKPGTERAQSCLCDALPGACPVHQPGVILRRLAGDEDVWQMARTGDWPRPNEGDGRVRLYEAAREGEKK